MTYPDFSEFSGLFMKLRQELMRQLPQFKQAYFLLAVSGGADSLFLAYFFIWLRRRDGVDFEILHFNHHLRPECDTQEADYLADFAKNWQVKYQLGEAEVKLRSRELKLGVEETARLERHSFFQAVRSKRRSEHPGKEVYLVLGHNQDDLLETFLLNLGRGAGLNGISTMPYLHNYLLRPLLTVRAKEIRQFMQERELQYFEDTSNCSSLYRRNRLRHELVPLWEDILDTRLGPVFAKLSENLQDENAALQYFADLALADCCLDAERLNLKKLCNWPQGLHYRILRDFIASYKAGLDQMENSLLSQRLLSYRQYRSIAETLAQLPQHKSFDLFEGVSLEIKSWQAILKYHAKV